MKPILLASSSPARRQLLSQLGIPFDCYSPNIDETPYPNEAPLALVERLSRSKAHRAMEHYPNHLIIAGDQVGVFEGQILGKPLTRTKAIENLQKLSGNSLTFYTGIAVGSQDGLLYDTVQTVVTFRELTTKQINHYIENEDALQCAGGLKVEGLGISLLSAIDTPDHSALIGLPLIRLNDFLHQMGCPLYS